MKLLRQLVAGRQLLEALSSVNCRFHPLIFQKGYSQVKSWDYDVERRNFDLKAPEFYNFSRDVVDKWAQKEKTGERSNNPALWWINESASKEEKWSFEEIAYTSRQAANILTGACQLSPGDVVIVILPRIPQWWVINIAAIRAGVILSPGTTLLRPSDIEHRLNASGARCIITNADCADSVDQVADRCPSLQTKMIVGGKRSGWLKYDDLMDSSSDTFQCIDTRSSDPMTVFFTSGTTGSPKMTEHTHSSYGLGHLSTARYFLGLEPDDVIWNLSDTGWAKCAWSSLFAPWLAGSCVFAQNSPKFDAKQTVKILAQFPISHFCAPPTAVRFIVKEDLSRFTFPFLKKCLSAGEPVILVSFPITVFCAPPTAFRFLQAQREFGQLKHATLKHSVCGGEPVNPELLKEWKDITGLTLYEGYGQTETTFLCGSSPNIEQRPGSMGKPAPGIDLQIVDDNGNIVPRGKEGNIAIKYRPNRPVGLFTKYVNDELRMSQAFKGDYYLTGDRGRMDEDSYVWFLSRADDVILSSGYRIGPFEVESALLEHPAVLESAVVSSPDPDRGEIVKAYILLTDDYKNTNKEELAAELQQHTKRVTAPYKYPRKIEFVDALPKTVSGKIRRVELRNKEWGRETD